MDPVDTWISLYSEAFNRAAFALVERGAIFPETKITVHQEAPFAEYISDLGIKFEFVRPSYGRPTET